MDEPGRESHNFIIVEEVGRHDAVDACFDRFLKGKKF